MKTSRSFISAVALIVTIAKFASLGISAARADRDSRPPVSYLLCQNAETAIYFSFVQFGSPHAQAISHRNTHIRIRDLRRSEFDRSYLVRITHVPAAIRHLLGEEYEIEGSSTAGDRFFAVVHIGRGATSGSGTFVYEHEGHAFELNARCIESQVTILPYSQPAYKLPGRH